MPLLSSPGPSPKSASPNNNSGFLHPMATAMYDQVPGSLNVLIGSMSGQFDASSSSSASATKATSQASANTTTMTSSSNGMASYASPSASASSSSSTSAMFRDQFGLGNEPAPSNRNGTGPLWWESLQNQRVASSPPAALRRVGMFQPQHQQAFAMNRFPCGNSGKQPLQQKPQYQAPPPLAQQDQGVYETAPVYNNHRATNLNSSLGPNMHNDRNGRGTGATGATTMITTTKVSNEDLRAFRSRVVAAIEHMFRHHSPHLVLTQVPENVNWQSKTFKLALKIEKLLFLSVKNHINSSTNGIVDASLYANAYLQMSTQALRQRVQMLATRLLKTRTQRHGQGPTSPSLEFTAVNSNGVAPNGVHSNGNLRPRY